MAKYGALYAQFAPFVAEAAEPDSSLPRYGTKFGLGPLQKVTDSFNKEEVRQDGDDELVEYLEEMSDFNVDVESAQMPLESERSLYGLTGNSGTDLEYSDTIAPPWGGYAFVRSLMISGTRYWQGIYYPKVKAQVQGEEDATKGKSMSFTGDKARFVGTKAKNGVYKVKSALKTTVADAKTWCDGKLAAYTPPAETGTT